MAELSLVIRERMSGCEFDVEVSETELVSDVVEAMRKELQFPEKDSRGHRVHKLVLTRTGVVLPAQQNLREAGVVDQDTLAFWPGW